MEGGTQYLAKTMDPQEIIDHIKDNVSNANILLKPTKLGSIIKLLFEYQRKIIDYPRDSSDKPLFKSQFPEVDLKTYKNGIVFLNDAILFSELVEKIGFNRIDVCSLVIKDEPPKETDLRRKKKNKEKEADKPLYSLLSNIINLDIFNTSTVAGIREQLKEVHKNMTDELNTTQRELNAKLATKQKLNDELNSAEYFGVEGEAAQIENKISAAKQQIAELKQNIEQIKLQNEQEKTRIEDRRKEMDLLVAETEKYNNVLEIDPKREKEKIEAAQKELEEEKQKTAELKQQFDEIDQYEREASQEYDLVYKTQEEIMDLLNKIRDIIKKKDVEKVIKGLEEEVENLAEEKERIEQQKAESYATIEELTKKHKEVINKIKTRKRDHSRAMSDIADEFRRLKESVDDYNKKLFNDLDEASQDN